ncbi:sporulation protein [Salipaludibacillus neizhouensis]|uniref:Sporulation protein n=1 Tax=Salipaludibacillus neizhouensis TaxID=885475 RepID=A0A3A9KLI9_9BACI|nr:stage VI sporulation protein F [Salipaludibacillus neizhouensis]RKL65686.1 sporulation protein [Salipaludibacillus neizhouensis]
MAFDKIFKNIQKKSGVKITDIIKLANSIQGANFKDEKTVREIVQKVAATANKSITKEKEDQIVKIITDDPNAININKISNMMDNKKQ